MPLATEQYSPVQPVQPVQVWLVGRQCGLVADVERYAVHTRQRCWLVSAIRYHAAMPCACGLYYDQASDELYSAATLDEKRSPLFYEGRAIVAGDILIYEVTPQKLENMQLPD